MIADKSINLDTLHKVLFDNEKLELSEECIRKVEESFDFLQSFSSDKIIYGINTGFGPMAQYRIEDQSLIDLQYNIIRRSHSTGAGKPLPELYVKSSCDCRLYTFLREVRSASELVSSSVNLSTAEFIRSYPNTEV